MPGNAGRVGAGEPVYTALRCHPKPVWLILPSQQALLLLWQPSAPLLGKKKPV